MARATSTISVAITGDSKKLQGALRGADKGVKGFAGSMKGAALGIGTALAGVFAVSKGFEFIQGALGEADRLGDSVSNLNRIIGKVNTKKIQKTADAFIDLGLSSADVQELSVGFARIAKSIGISPHIIGRYATDVAAVAQSLSLVDEHGRDAATWIEMIAKAAAKPSFKTAKDLGINLARVEKLTNLLALKETGKKSAKDLTPAEKAAARLKVILNELKPLIAETLANPDVELKQKILGAKIEELQGKIGQGLQPVVADLLQNIIDISESEWVDDMVKGIETLQGKHDVAVFEDLKTGIATVQAAIGIAVDEGSADIKQLQDAFTVQLPAGIQVAADALSPFNDAVQDVTDTITDLAGAFVDLPETIGGALDVALRAIVGFVTDAKGLIGGLIDLMGHLGNVPGSSSGIHSGRVGGIGPASLTDQQISDAITRQRRRNGLGA
jgi:hypothetical protein